VNSRAKKVARDVALSVALLAVYVVAGKYGLKLAFLNASATSVWAPTGIAIAAVLLAGYRVWIPIFIGAFLVNFTTAGNIITSLWIASGNTLEAVAAGYLVNRYAGGTQIFLRVKNIFLYIVIAGVVATAISATSGVTVLALNGFVKGGNYGPVWLTWWLGDFVSALLVAPFILIWSMLPFPNLPPRRIIEAAIILGVSIVAMNVEFGGFLVPGTQHYQIVFLGTPLLLWATFRFGHHGAITVALITSGIAIFYTINGLGPFAFPDRNIALLLLQGYMGTIGITALILATVLFEQKGAEEEIRKLNIELERRVLERTEQLTSTNKELEAFSYSVSHDLQAPLRAINGFAGILREDYGERIDDEGRRLLLVIKDNTARMSRLINDLLSFSRLARREFERDEIDMTMLTRSVINEIGTSESASAPAFVVGSLPKIHGDGAMLRQVMTNLLSNAIKFSAKAAGPRVEIGFRDDRRDTIYYVRDNGVGFDDRYAGKLFGVFQRLHTEEEFGGTGIGLAIVQRIVQRHGGRVWAESPRGQGATFYFSLPKLTEVE